MDLFNPPPKFNLNYMTHDLEVSNLDNPFIQVVWEDVPQNFTQEKIKSVRHYFQKKYNTTNVNVLTKSKELDKETSIQSVDVSFNILDKNYQLTLMKDYLNTSSNEKILPKILELDNSVETKLIQNQTETIPFKRWYIKNIEFSNFLSYGLNQKIDFEKCSGITVVESNPPNFGGKSVLSVDLLLFLFFNETTKTTKAEEIFNRYSTHDKVNVRGEVEIDGDTYVIVRQIERKKSKSGDWNIKTELDFFKKLSDGSLINFTGEQRRETENFLKSSIGTKEDFLMTILTTATNLEDLIDSKPTARGQILSRFMGLDFIKIKEEAAKGLYSDFSKSMMSNVYNSEELKTEIENNKIKIFELEVLNNELNSKLVEVQERIIKGQTYRDGLLKSKHNDIDKEISLLKPEKLKQEKETLELQKKGFSNQIKEINVIEPSSFYYEEEHDKIKEEYQKTLKSKLEVEISIDSIKKLQESVENGIKCEHCGIELVNASITQSKISELAGFITQNDQLSTLLQDLSGKEQSFVKSKKEFDEYEKNKLIKEKYEISLESTKLKIEKIDENLKKYFEVQDKISENDKIETLLIKADVKIGELETEKNKYSKQISNNIFQIDSIKDKIESSKKMILIIQEESEKEKIYKIYLEIFGKNGISKKIMKTMMPLINSELQRLLDGSCYFRLEIRINDKNEVEFLMIDNNTQVEKLMISGSGYERTIASLALRAVLSKICSLPKPNIIVFDEVFGKISNENLEMVSEFFLKIKEYFEKIFVISHNPIISTWSDNVVRIEKIDNISKIIQ
jgi:DNA repair exonuclease SbcCD ATPase subunit